MENTLENKFEHTPVMLNECIDSLNIKPQGTYVDGTLGGGGHSGEILKRLTTGKLIAFDKDDDALASTSKKLESSGDELTISDNNLSENEITFSATVGYNGQLFIRARAEKSETELGRWSEVVPFTINTVPADSMDSTFLDQSLTTFELFEDEFNMTPLAINEKSHISDVTDVAFYMEFNKAIKLPEDYKTNEDGYVSLGIVTGFRKGLK
jgi:hypothetical protein